MMVNLTKSQTFYNANISNLARLCFCALLFFLIYFTYYLINGSQHNSYIWEKQKQDKTHNSLSESEIRYKYNTFDTKESEFLFDLEANEEWFVDGVKGDNITGFDHYIVPNIVHYILLDVNEINFVHYLSIKTVFNVHKPDKIMIHCNCDELKGKYFEKLKNEYKDEMKEKFLLIKVEKPETVFGIEFHKPYQLYHASDVLRIMALLQFGGIYLDRDVYVIQSLDRFRKFEMTIDYEFSGPTYIGNQVLIGHKRSRFLKLYLQLYKKFDGKQWYTNAGLLPKQKIISKYPHLVHSLNREFGSTGFETCAYVYIENNNNWKQKYYTIHLLMRGNSVHNVFKWCSKTKPSIYEFNEQIVKSLNTTFGQMARLVIYNTTKLIIK